MKPNESRSGETRGIAHVLRCRADRSARVDAAESPWRIRQSVLVRPNTRVHGLTRNVQDGYADELQR